MDGTEEWKPVPGFEEDYLISSFGRVKSITERRGSYSKINNGILGCNIAMTRHGKPGYVRVILRKDKKPVYLRMHRLVMLAFGNQPDSGENLEVCHNDGNPLNNNISNLRWDTHKSNVYDSIKHGTNKPPPYYIGDTHPRSKLTIVQKNEIASYLYRRGIIMFLSKKYGVSATHIGRVRRERGIEK